MAIRDNAFLDSDRLHNDSQARFRATLHNPQHGLRQLLHPLKQTGYNFCSRGDGHILPEL